MSRFGCRPDLPNLSAISIISYHGVFDLTHAQSWTMIDTPDWTEAERFALMVRLQQIVHRIIREGHVLSLVVTMANGL